MAGKYAAGTSVPVSRSRDEIEHTLTRFGAGRFAYYADEAMVAIQFEIAGIRVLMRMPLPSREPFRRDSRGRDRRPDLVEKDWEQACRQRWRSLANGVKAKLALIDDGISTIEREFLADIVLPDGATVGERVVPEIRQAVATGDLPPMMPGLPAPTQKVIALPATSEGRR